MCQGTVNSRPPLSADTIAEEMRRLRGLLREGGHSVTAKRCAVYETLLRTNDHICAEHMLESVQREHPTWHVNKTTIYRTLELLMDLGLVSVMKQPDGRAQYELTLHGPHGHLLCRECGALRDLEPEVAGALRADLARQHFFVDLDGQAIIGLCEACRSRIAV